MVVSAGSRTLNETGVVFTGCSARGSGGTIFPLLYMWSTGGTVQHNNTPCSKNGPTVF